METATHSEHLVRFKAFELDLVTRELRRDGQRLKLHGHPINLLAILLERPGQWVPREEFRNRLWPKDTSVDSEQILNNSVGKLRDALGDRAEDPQLIETLPRFGYRFIASVEATATYDTPPANTAAETSAVILPTEPPAQPQFLVRTKNSERWIMWLAAVVLVALLAVGSCI